ncbi:MAG: sulfatase modifying factor 1 [Arenicella sp.]|jgi:sulfatase modifying factor 1
MKYALVFLSLFIGTLAISQTELTEKDVKKMQKKFLKTKDYVFVPSVTIRRESDDQDVPYKMIKKPREISIDSFYIDKFELSNWEYLLYIDFLKQTHPDLVDAAMPDTTVWRDKYAYYEPYVEYYLRHPAYRSYPVVGVSFNQAIDYCKWATKSYNHYPDRIFKEILIRLPTEEEWQYAARSGGEYQALPWRGNSVFDDEGELMANFGYVSQIAIYKDSLWRFDARRDTFVKKEFLLSEGVGSENTDILAPVDAYYPNAFGLYNMAGNVEEFVISTAGGTSNTYDYFMSGDTISNDSSGITRGGSWRDPGAYMRTNVRQFYSGRDYSSAEIGFRLVLEVVEY